MRIERSVRPGMFLSNGRMMCKKAAEVKKKERGKMETRTWREQGELIAFRLSENVARQAATKQEARAGILLGKSGEPFASGIEVASAFDAKIPAVGVFDQNIVAKCARGRVRGNHSNFSPDG